MPEDNLPESIVPELPFYWDFVQVAPNELAQAEDIMLLQQRINDALESFAVDSNANFTELVSGVVGFNNAVRAEVIGKIDALRQETRALLVSNAFREYIQEGDGVDDNGLQLGGGGETSHPRTMFTVPQGKSFFVTYWSMDITVYGRYSVGTPFMGYEWPNFAGTGGGQNPGDFTHLKQEGTFDNPLFRLDGPYTNPVMLKVDRCGAHFRYVVQGYLVETSAAGYFGLESNT